LEPWALGPLEPWTLGPLEPWTLGPLDPWTLEALDPWSIGPSDPWNLAPLDPWSLGPSEYWILGPLDPWTPVQVLTDVKNVAAGNHTVFVKNDATAWATGYNDGPLATMTTVISAMAPAPTGTHQCRF
jgi:hypothetical protein